MGGVGREEWMTGAGGVGNVYVWGMGPGCGRE